MSEIVTLCGSTKFKLLFEEINRNFTLEGKIVLQPGCFAHYDNIIITEEQKIKLDELHKKKILLSQFIYVINEGGYIGTSTQSEIDFANEHNIQVYYYHEV